METTRHFTATVYLVHDGATALHDHRRLGMMLPPGGHIDRDELPHEAAVREAREETGLEPTLVTDHDQFGSSTARTIPRPRHLLLEDVNRHGDVVGHQHVDHIFYASVETRTIDPVPSEVGPDGWEWYTPSDLDREALDDDVCRLGREAIDVVSASLSR